MGDLMANLQTADRERREVKFRKLKFKLGGKFSSPLQKIQLHRGRDDNKILSLSCSNHGVRSHVSKYVVSNLIKL